MYNVSDCDGALSLNSESGRLFKCKRNESQTVEFSSERRR